MSRETLNGCVGCPPHLGCMHEACPYWYETHYYCDSCGDDLDPSDLHEYDGQDYCDSCLIEKLLADGEIQRDPSGDGYFIPDEDEHVSDDDLISYLEDIDLIQGVNTDYD